MYKIIFEDNSELVCKSNPLTNSKWNDIPNKLIKSIEYSYAGMKVKLTGYSSYNHLVGHKIGLFTKIKQTNYIKLLAYHDYTVKIFTWDLINCGFKEEVFNIVNSFKSTGWKNGLSNKNPSYKINP